MRTQTARMEQPPPSQILLQAEIAAAPSFFVPVSAANMLSNMLSSQTRNLDGSASMLSTGVHALDEGVLSGGIPTGYVVGISSSGSENMGRIIALRLLVRDLLKFDNRDERAMIIDSTGSFPLSTLVEIAKGCVGELDGPLAMTRMPDGRRMPWRERALVEGVLSRIGISRVFDVEGVWDVVCEIRAGRKEGGDGEQGDGGEECGVEMEHEQEVVGTEASQDKLHIEGYGVQQLSVRAGARTQHEGGQSPPVDDDTDVRRTQHPPSAARHKSASQPDTEESNSQGTHAAHKLSKSPSMPDFLNEVGRPLSSPLPPPPASKEVESSSPLSSPPKSPTPAQDAESDAQSLCHSVSSSSLASQLIIGPSPLRNNTNTVLRQAYHGGAIPSSSPLSPATLVSPLPLPVSPPHVTISPTPIFKPATAGFESLMSEATHHPQLQGDDNNSSSDTSSYISSASNSPQKEAPKGSQWHENGKTKEPPRLLLIDSLPPLLTNVFGTSERTVAHRQLYQLSRVLTQMSRSTTYPLTVLILNSTTVLSPEKSIAEWISRSIFGHVKRVPSFGVVYEGMVDLNLMVSSLPARQEDAERLYGGAEGGGRGGVRWTNVLECLRDDVPDLNRWTGDEEGRGIRKNPGRRINREGQWGAFDIVKEGAEGEELVLRDPELGKKIVEHK